MVRIITAVMLITLICTLTPAVHAQNQLDPKPLNPKTDPDIDMFMCSWKESIPFNTHGRIVERTIFTPHDGDQLHPQKRGAVLSFVKRFSRAHLEAGFVTTPTTLTGEQEVFYITGGKGTVTAGGKTHELRKGIIFLVPAELEFTIQNTGDEIMTMYLIVEPIPDGFRPNDEILVKDENSMAYRDQGFLTVHWSHNGLNVFTVKDGLGTLESVNILTFNAMTIGQPHSHDESTEEVWTMVEGKNLAFLGKEIRWQEPGTAYKIPPNGQTPHSNINTTERPAKFLYFSRFREHEVRK